MKRSTNLVGLWLLVAAGCRTPAPDPAIPPPRPDPVRYVGTVIKTDHAGGYVIVEGPYLPTAGKEVRVYRNGRPVGTVRFTDARRPPHGAADVVEGMPRVGDVLATGRATGTSPR